MRVGIYRQNVGIERQPEIVGHHEVARARRNVESVIVLQFHDEREFRFGPAGEV